MTVIRKEALSFCLGPFVDPLIHGFIHSTLTENHYCPMDDRDETLHLCSLKTFGLGMKRVQEAGDCNAVWQGWQ